MLQELFRQTSFTGWESYVHSACQATKSPATCHCEVTKFFPYVEVTLLIKVDVPFAIKYTPLSLDHASLRIIYTQSQS